MPDVQARLIEAAVRPFADDGELKLAAAGFLEKRVTPDAAAAVTMLARWNEVDARKRKSVWHIGLWMAVAVVSAGVAFSDFDEISRLVPWGKWLAAGSVFAPGPADVESRIAGKLSESDKLLLFGDLSKDTKDGRKKALWQSEPENPAYFADYAGAFISETGNLPPDILATARRIDPANAWFTYLAAAVEVKDAVKKIPRKGRRVDGKWVNDPQSWEILDQARLDRAMALLAEARTQPEWAAYSAALLRKRLPLLPAENLIDQLDSGSCLAAVSVFSSLRLRVLADAMAAQAWNAGESGDVVGFHEISGDGDRLLRGICSDEPGTLLDELVNSVLATILSESFAAAAQTLRLETDAAPWMRISTLLVEERQARDSRILVVDGKAVKPSAIPGGILGGTSLAMIARRVKAQPPLTDADLKPLRLVDHEFLSWGLSHVLWAVVALGACLVAIYRFRVAVLPRRLARRMVDLLRPADWGWIIAAGVLLPWVFVMAVNRLTPWGGRAFGVQGMELLLPAGHFYGLVLLWLILPPQVVRWRLRNRAGGFGFPGPTGMGWLVVGCAVAFVPMIGWAAISLVDGEWLKLEDAWKLPWQFWAALALAGVSMVWMAGLILVAIFGRAGGHFHRATSSLVLVRTYAVALLVIALGSIGFKASERDWFKQDWMSKFDVSGPGWTAYEFKVAAQMRKELRGTLGYDR
jgi:hypothetical protein